MKTGKFGTNRLIDPSPCASVTSRSAASGLASSEQPGAPSPASENGRAPPEKTVSEKPSTRNAAEFGGATERLAVNDCPISSPPLIQRNGTFDGHSTRKDGRTYTNTNVDHAPVPNVDRR